MKCPRNGPSKLYRAVEVNTLVDMLVVNDEMDMHIRSTRKICVRVAVYTSYRITLIHFYRISAEMYSLAIDKLTRGMLSWGHT